ncbi:MAG: hypothetical protein MRZ79_23360 [Bacteroidia bacterium]|nr:hypothetical protein [Bacteroidia bacterium]
MKRRFLLALLWIVLGGGLSFLVYLLSNFYILFSQSDQLFAWKHKHIPALVFHTDQWGYESGEEVNIYASWRGGDSVDLYLFDILQKDTLLHEKVWVEHQEVKRGVAIGGTNWTANYSLKLPSGSPTGWFVLGLKKDKSQFYQSIFIQPRVVKKKIAFLFSTNTWNAYNFWGGHSIYSKNKTDAVSFRRPQLLADPFLKNSFPNHQLYFQAANKDRYVAEMLDTAEYQFDAFSMEDLEASQSILYEYDVWIISTHSEYWTKNMLNNLNTYLDSGGSFVNLAGNVAAYESFLNLNSRQLKVQRAIENLWEERDSLGLRPFGMKPGFLGFHTYAPYQIEKDSSWLLQGTELENGDLIGQVSDSYDYTYMYGSWLERIWGLRKKGKRGAASGLEIDQLYEGTPDNWVTVAAGLNPRLDGKGEVYPQEIAVPWQRGEGGYIGYYEHPAGGIVFGTGSMAFTGALPYDENCRTIVLNAIRRAVKE